jgi:hypothetical protein
MFFASDTNDGNNFWYFSTLRVDIRDLRQHCHPTQRCLLVTSNVTSKGYVKSYLLIKIELLIPILIFFSSAYLSVHHSTVIA